MQNGIDTLLHTQLAELRRRALGLARQAGDQAEIYELVSSLAAAAEAVLEGTIDERVMFALDLLAEVVEEDVDEETELVAPALRRVSAA